MVIDDITPQWLAGFFDGEGSISIGLHGSSYRTTVEISQSNFLLIHIIAAKFPRNTIFHDKRRMKSTYVIHWTGSGAKDILEYILPFLILKKKRAIAALELISTIGHVGQRISDEDLKIRNNSYDIIKKANKEQNEDFDIQVN